MLVLSPRKRTRTVPFTVAGGAEDRTPGRTQVQSVVSSNTHAALSVKSTVADGGVIPTGQPGPYRVPSPTPSRVSGFHV